MMSTDDFSPTIEDLQREVAELRQQNAEFRRLASFPQLNPNPVLEFDRNGQVLYLNPATHQTLSQIGSDDASIFLPDDFAEMSSITGEKAAEQFLREMKIHERILEEKIYYSQEYDTFRIYTTDITQRKKMEEAFNQSNQELMRTQDLLEAVTKGTDVIIATIDKNFCYTYFNQAYQEELKRLSGRGYSNRDEYARCFFPFTRTTKSGGAGVESGT